MDEVRVKFIVRPELVMEVNVPPTGDLDADRQVAADLAEEYLNRRIRVAEALTLTGEKTPVVRIVEVDIGYPEHCG